MSGFLSSAAMDEIRDRIRDRMAATGISKRALSLKLHRAATYMHDYLEKGSPEDLDLETKLKLAEILAMPPNELGINSAIVAALPAPRAGGLAEDAEPYHPPKGSFLADSPHIAFFRQKSHSLDQHEKRILPGDLLAFNLNHVEPATIATGTVVVVNLLDKHDFAKGHGTITRQFIAPNKLITNSSRANDIISLDDPTQPWEAVIKGTLLSVIRES